MHQSLVINLIEIGALIEHRQSLEDGLRDLAALTARFLSVERCSVMLLVQKDERDEPELRVCSHYGDLPEDAYHATIALAKGIAGRVVQDGQTQLINDIDQSPFAGLAHQGAGAGDAFMSAPIRVADQVVGVINVSRRSNGRRFETSDLELLQVFALFIGKSIHVLQLQQLSKSRLLQMAQLIEQRNGDKARVAPISPDPARLAKIVAKSFYRELMLAGFGPQAIIAVASEVLGQLQENLDKHRKRVAREGERTGE